MRVPRPAASTMAFLGIAGASSEVDKADMCSKLMEFH